MIWEEILRSARILIVDDEPANVALLERMLDQAGYQGVASTTDSRAVLELFRELRPDLILLETRYLFLELELEQEMGTLRARLRAAGGGS